MTRNLKILLLILPALLLQSTILSQPTDRNWRLYGHLQTMQQVWVPPDVPQWQTMTALSNRLDFRWHPGNKFSFHAGVRNNANLGQMVFDYHPYLADFSTMDDGLIDLTRLWINDSSIFFYSSIDRMNVKFRTGNFEATVGRQRINWGINLIWTPNDIFNAYNYFDFDYVERPGCDAVLLQYYTGYTSSLQFGFKVDRHLYAIDSVYKVTSALMYRFNRWGYDFQFLGGIMREDAVAGIGWAGHIKGAGFSGEASYFLDRKQLFDTTGAVVASAEMNYTFSNSLYLQGGYLYNSAGTTGPAGWGTAFMLAVDISAKNLTRARHSLFAQTSYPITPLINASLAGIFNPNDKSGFAGPSIDLSLTTNLSLLLTGQIFWGANQTAYGDYGSLFFMRLKWSF